VALVDVVAEGAVVAEAGGPPLRLRVRALPAAAPGAACVVAGVRLDVVCAHAGRAIMAAVEASNSETRRVRAVFMRRNIASRRPDGKT
jgi:hypothetical protein